MRRRVIATVLSATLVLGLMPACSSVKETAQKATSALESALSLTVSKETGEVSITRAKATGERPAVDEGTWTVLVYLCGSDLETKAGSATADLAEMVAASGSEDVSFVVQTGGADQWQNSAVDPAVMQRFLIQDTSIMEVDSVSEADMGESNTLADFVRWGWQNYPADNMGLILWNHGGGSISGVCFDERNGDDALVLRELDSALADCQDTMWDKFEFVGFDACLMGSVETANVLASYANYMIASEEWEPGSGWDYTTFMEYLAENPSADGDELGRVIVDSYHESLSDDPDKDIATLSVVDLSKVDDVITSFNSFAKEIYDASGATQTLADVMAGITSADNYGGNNKSEGYSNMVDLGGIADKCSAHAPGASDVLSAIDDAVVYKKNGTDHPNASGLSVYYPLQAGDSDELSTFEAVCVSPYYLSFVDRREHGSASNGLEEYESYSDDEWYDDNDVWDWSSPSSVEDYWSFLDDEGQDDADSEQSALITFAEEPEIVEGRYGFRLDDVGIVNALGVSAVVYQHLEDDDVMLELGETYDVDGDWESGIFEDAFDGRWLSLPDGQNLDIYVADYTDDYVVYATPISLNGRDTNLRIRQYFDDGTTVVEGAWDGIAEDGSSARGTTAIEKGDVIVPLYYAYEGQDEEETIYEGEEYTVGPELAVDYDLLYDGEYYYSFCIEDLLGNYYQTDEVTFNVDENGDVTFG